MRALGLRPVGEEAGHAVALADYIEANRPSKQLLFLCGDRRRDVLPDRLRAAGMPQRSSQGYHRFGSATNEQLTARAIGRMDKITRQSAIFTDFRER